ncbi:hypothetical protein GCM10009127_04970 [Alteraurantiacibacter aestuarii]|uniref:Uncharacterized protein n=1 Tax=Alteraurantiacibacter aestuarii TaxID=650004 RepID=A0A844ZL09_9SPHN|nr:hypothetical protein [Alteraurantiacibacter aestuarii]MXO88253.1 hypothetical protein [Alteraurantiacibacter aestuarii]
MTMTFRRALACLAGAAIALTAAPAAANSFLGDPLARFEEPICPGIIGLQEDFATAMVARIRENAERIGLATANMESCDANLIIAFFDDGRSYFQRLADERGYLFLPLSVSERRELIEEAGPARAWITTETRTRDGMVVGRRENMDDLPTARVMAAHSRIYVPIRREITSSMVVIDRAAVSGLSVNQLADYATLRGIAQTYPESDEGAASILTLFDSGADAPAGLTEFDSAYLERLYSSIPNLPASSRLRNLE